MNEAEFLASVAEAAKASGETTDDTSLGADDSTADAGSGTEPGTAADDDAVDSNDADGAADGESAAADSGVLSPESVAELLTNGDLAELAKRVGVDPKILKVNTGKLKADREILRQAKTAEAAAKARDDLAATKLTEAERLIDAGKRTYGWAVDLKNMISSGDLLGVKELVMTLAPKGVTWEQINAGIVKAEKGDNPSEVMYRALLRKQAQERVEAERAEREKAAKESAKTAEAEQAKRNLESATAKLKGTPFEKVPRAAETLVQIVNDAYDSVRGGYTITPQQALKKLAEDPLIALALKAVRAGKTPVSSAETARRNGKGQFVTPNRSAEKRIEKRGPSGKDDAKRQRDAEFAASIAEAAKLEAAELRRMGGPRR